MRGLVFLGLLVGLLSLVGCGTAPKEPPTRYVPVACLTQDQLEQLKQTEPKKIGDQLTGQAQTDAKIIGEVAVKLRAWGLGLLGVLEGCAEK